MNLKLNMATLLYSGLRLIAKATGKTLKFQTKTATNFKI
jgi:hypothetical protein